VTVFCLFTGAQNDPWTSSPTGQAAGGAGAFGGGGSDPFGAPAAINGTNGAATIDYEFDMLSSRSNTTSPSKSAGLDEFDLLGGELKSHCLH
jgi:hypothetical protein